MFQVTSQEKQHKMLVLILKFDSLTVKNFFKQVPADLVSNLQPEDFSVTKKIFKDNIDLLTKKGVYPYDYVSPIGKFEETQLPPKSEYYSKLKQWRHFRWWLQTCAKCKSKCKTIKDYHDLYVKSDVLLIADVFENFRKTCLKHNKLDPKWGAA